MKFGVFADLHYDIVPDADRRVDELISDFEKKNVEFIVELGDLCNPTKENRKLLQRFNNTNVPCYFSTGNHNTDLYPIQTVIDFFGLTNSYYSFIRNNIKFIVLDANFTKTLAGCVPYCKRNYNISTDETPYIPQEQISWLENELRDDYYCIIISHHSLTNDFQKRGISNRKEVQSLLERQNKNRKKVLLCLNGHDHGDDVKLINGIYYYTLNSASYIWHGVKEVYAYSNEIHEKYPYLKNMILYEEPLHIIISIDNEMNVRIDGMNGHYQKVTPKEIGLESTWNGVSIEPKTTSLFFSC